MDRTPAVLVRQLVVLARLPALLSVLLAVPTLHLLPVPTLHLLPMLQRWELLVLLVPSWLHSSPKMTSGPAWKPRPVGVCEGPHALCRKSPELVVTRSIFRKLACGYEFSHGQYIKMDRLNSAARGLMYWKNQQCDFWSRPFVTSYNLYSLHFLSTHSECPLISFGHPLDISNLLESTFLLRGY